MFKGNCSPRLLKKLSRKAAELVKSLGLLPGYEYFESDRGELFDGLFSMLGNKWLKHKSTSIHPKGVAGFICFSEYMDGGEWCEIDAMSALRDWFIEEYTIYGHYRPLLCLPCMPSWKEVFNYAEKYIKDPLEAMAPQGSEVIFLNDIVTDFQDRKERLTIAKRGQRGVVLGQDKGGYWGGGHWVRVIDSSYCCMLKFGFDFVKPWDGCDKEIQEFVLLAGVSERLLSRDHFFPIEYMALSDFQG